MSNLILNSHYILDFFISLFENYLMIKFISLYFEKKYNIEIFSALIITVISYIINLCIYPPIYTSFFLILLLSIYSYINLLERFDKIIIVILLTFLNLFVVNMSIGIVASILNVNIFKSISSLNNEYFIVVSFQKSVLLIEYLYLKKFYSKKIENCPKSTKSILLLLHLVMLLPEIIITSYISKKGVSYTTVLICIVDFIAICLIASQVYINMSKNYKKLIEQEILLESKKYEKKLLVLLNQKIEQINKINHDIANHKLVIDNLINNNKYSQAQNYINDLTPSYIFTNNEIINFILNDKIEISKSLNIDIKYFIQGDLKHTISDIDLSILLGNLLDNAISGARNSSKKYITVTIKQDNYKLIINIKNSYSTNNIKYLNGKYLSTKRKGLKSGYGLSNIKQICEKYNGIDKIEHNQNEFIHTCILLINSK